jgi:hypothetical protein
MPAHQQIALEKTLKKTVDGDVVDAEFEEVKEDDKKEEDK